MTLFLLDLKSNSGCCGQFWKAPRRRSPRFWASGCSLWSRFPQEQVSTGLTHRYRGHTWKRANAHSHFKTGDRYEGRRPGRRGDCGLSCLSMEAFRFDRAQVGFMLPLAGNEGLAGFDYCIGEWKTSNSCANLCVYLFVCVYICASCGQVQDHRQPSNPTGFQRSYILVWPCNTFTYSFPRSYMSESIFCCERNKQHNLMRIKRFKIFISCIHFHHSFPGLIYGLLGARAMQYNIISNCFWDIFFTLFLIIQRYFCCTTWRAASCGLCTFALWQLGNRFSAAFVWGYCLTLKLQFSFRGYPPHLFI